MFLVSVSGWFLVFLEITRALIPLLALWLNRAYPVSSVLFRLVTFRTASWAHLFTLYFLLFHFVAFCEQNLICHFLPSSHLAAFGQKETGTFGAKSAFDFNILLISYLFFILCSASHTVAPGEL